MSTYPRKPLMPRNLKPRCPTCQHEICDNKYDSSDDSEDANYITKVTDDANYFVSDSEDSSYSDE